jgi:hypothetical protein
MVNEKEKYIIMVDGHKERQSEESPEELRITKYFL